MFAPLCAEELVLWVVQLCAVPSMCLIHLGKSCFPAASPTIKQHQMFMSIGGKAPLQLVPGSWFEKDAANAPS